MAPEAVETACEAKKVEKERKEEAIAFFFLSDLLRRAQPLLLLSPPPLLLPKKKKTKTSPPPGPAIRRHQLQHLRLHRLQRRPVSFSVFFFSVAACLSLRPRGREVFLRPLPLSVFPFFFPLTTSPPLALLEKKNTKPRSYTKQQQPAANSPTASRGSPWRPSSPRRSPPSRRRATRSSWAPTSRGGLPRTCPSRRAGSRRG